MNIKNKRLGPYRKLMTYEEAMKWAAKNLLPFGINTQRKVSAWKKGEFPNAPISPPDFFWPPSSPHFKGWPDFFGRKEYHRANGLRRLEWPSYEEFKQIVIKSGACGVSEYREFYKKSKLALPYNPNVAYREEWEGWKTLNEKETRGGHGINAGRKPKSPEGRRKQLTVSLLPSHYEALKSLNTSEALDMGLEHSIPILTALKGV